jgi:hypothetical protein
MQPTDAFNKMLKKTVSFVYITQEREPMAKRKWDAT